MAKGRKAKKNDEATSSLLDRLTEIAESGDVDLSDYREAILGLVFLRYLSTAFTELFDRLTAETSSGAVPEDRDEYTAENVFWVPQDARWAKIQAAAKTADIGKIIDYAMVPIEAENPALKGVLPKDYNRPDWVRSST